MKRCTYISVFLYLLERFLSRLRINSLDGTSLESPQFQTDEGIPTTLSVRQVWQTPYNPLQSICLLLLVQYEVTAIDLLKNSGMFWSTVATPIVGLGVVGAILLSFPDVVVSHFSLRIAVSCCLLTVLGVFVTAFFIFRHAVTSPITSIGMSTVLAGVGLLGSSLGWSDNLHEFNRYAIVFFILCGLCSVLATTYIDSSLDPRHQKLLVIGCGLGACIVAAAMDYPQFTSLMTDLALYILLFLLRRVYQPRRLTKKKVTYVDDARSVGDTRSVRSEMEEEDDQHPLVFKGLIVNPETMRNIKIGAKKYTDLISQGYRPDFTNAISVVTMMSSDIKVSPSLNMSRATDAFSSLISNVPGVDTSCFVKRTLNDLKSKDSTPPATTPVQSQQTVIKTTQPATLDFSFASDELDALGKPSTPKQGTTHAVILEDLFEHIPCCEEPVNLEASPKFQDASAGRENPREDVHHLSEWTEDVAQQQPSPKHVDGYPAQSAMTQPDAFQLDIESRSGYSMGGDIDDTSLVETPSDKPEPIVFNEAKNNVLDGSSINMSMPESYQSVDYQDGSTAQEGIGVGRHFQETLNSKATDLKATFEKCRTKLNKKAVHFKKKGLKAMRQGFDVAQEWMDKCMEDRKQHRLTSSQRKDDTKRIEHFLTEMEALSHYRREQLMSELPPEFFQKVIDYAEAKGMAVEHLFVTGESNAYEAEPVLGRDRDRLEDTETEEQDSEFTSDFQSQGGCLEVTGEETSTPSEEDCDLLGLSSDRPDDSIPQCSHPTMDFVDPDDLDAFFAVGPVTDRTVVDILGDCEDTDLMQFEDGHRSETASDFSDMYHRLKQGGRHSESEIRAILKDKRHQEKETKMAAALQAKVDRERQSEAQQEELHRLKERHIQKISEWKEQHARNMRGLLTTLQTVLWENSGWKAMTLGDVLEVPQVKKAYMKANLIIHPDKVKQKGGTAEQVVIADMIFNVLKEAWQHFQT